MLQRVVKELWRSVVEKCCDGVLSRSVAENCCREGFVKKYCGEVLWGSVVEKCCGEMLEGGSEEVLWRSVLGK